MLDMLLVNLLFSNLLVWAMLPELSVYNHD